MATISELVFESPDGKDVKRVVEIAESLFTDARVGYKRRNRRGEVYSIAKEATYDFLSWDSMPWER
jgi:hypothetical protein